jgi:hypothetical protein
VQSTQVKQEKQASKVQSQQAALLYSQDTRDFGVRVQCCTSVQSCNRELQQTATELQQSCKRAATELQQICKLQQSSNRAATELQQSCNRARSSLRVIVNKGTRKKERKEL